MTREEAIQWLKVINTKEFGWDEFALQESQREIRERCEQGVREAIDMAIEALSADAVKVAYICDGRKCDNDCSECFRTLDIEHARDFKKMGGTYYQQELADTVPTVIRTKTFMRKEDFNKWAEDIKKQNKSIVCIPYDAEVVSADAVVRCKDCKHWDTADGECYGHDFYYCSEANDYCSRGERREQNK